MAKVCEVCTCLPSHERTKDPSRRPRPVLLQDRIVFLCDPHGECVAGTGADTVERLHELCVAALAQKRSRHERLYLEARS